MNERLSPEHWLAIEKREWLESLEYLLDRYGEDGARQILRDCQNHLLGQGLAMNEATLNTPYVNTIAVSEQPQYPGNVDLEKRIENIIRWNAMAMVMQAQDSGSGVGGHIATYASAATMMETGFHHFFRARGVNYGGDLVVLQPHAAPGVYARAFVEGRLNTTQLTNFRRQLQPGGGLSSYPHPRHMPEFWNMPNASMGLSTPAAIYQARFAKYLERRGLKPDNGGKVWCFIGDGEADEPEVLGTVNIASREQLDNLILVVNCNLQRLDGPVRGNGKIIQELERSFRGADWNVIKVIWGGGWDKLLAEDHQGVLRQRMEEAVDGEYQYYSVSTGDVQRELWVEGNPELDRMMSSLSDEEVKMIKRGGQDPKKIFAAFAKAQNADGPTVVLVKTVKGDGMGTAQAKNTVHQKKNLSEDERIACAAEYGIPLTEDQIRRAEFYRPDNDSEEMRYLLERRETLGGFLPSRETHYPPLKTPALSVFGEFLAGTGDRAVSTTQAVVRLLSTLMKHERIGKYVVPIVPDEARTFGMDPLFKQAGIYSPDGQNYTPVDGNTLLPYKEAEDGQILQEGICETGAMASFLAAGTAYAVHGVPTIPFYIFYSIFGFQRVGDMIWSCADMMCRGFLLGGTAGRTTLNGEGLQHQDGHSHVVANTVPNMKSYDPAFAYELVLIIRDGIRRMYENQENVFYYITVYNENVVMPALPGFVADDEAKTPEVGQAIHDGILRGLYKFQHNAQQDNAQPKAHLLASGSIMQQALLARPLLESFGISVDIWSVTSFNELYRDGIETERWNMLNVEQTPRKPYVTQQFEKESGVFVAVSDYMKALANNIARWVPGEYRVLGTDGFGVSESRQDLRDYFEISPPYICLAVANALYAQGTIDHDRLVQIRNALDIKTDKVNPSTV